MFDHISIGVRDLARAKRFYDAALAPLGYTCLSAAAEVLGYGHGQPALWVYQVKKPAVIDAACGLHFCLEAADARAVDAFHAAALAYGGSDNGKPGLRADYGPGYYAAFAIDPDGYRLEAHYHQV